MPREFECRREIVVPASPEEVWEAVATKQGNAAWLFPNDVEDATNVWEPPNHYAVRQQQGDWFNALEFQIEGREGGRTLVRYLHSGIFVEDWDNQYDAVQQHTDFYLHTLGQYLQHFKGRRATYIGDVPGGIQGPAGSATPDGFARLQRALGLGQPMAEGDAVKLSPDGVQALDGVIDYLVDNFMGIRTADALYCFFGRNAFGAPVALSIHAFAPKIDAPAVRQAWERWLNAVLA